MSFFNFQSMDDLYPSWSDHERSEDEGSTESDSVMLSGLSTASTTDLTIVDQPSYASYAPSTRADSPTPSLGDHGAAIMPPDFFFVSRSSNSNNNGESAAHQRSDTDDDASALSEFGGTIVSSAPSGTQIDSPALEASWDVMETPPPRIIHRDNASISTTESMYRDLASMDDTNRNHDSTSPRGWDDDDDDDDDDSSIASSRLSLHPSMMESSVVSESKSLSSDNTFPAETQGSECHPRATFVNVGDRLALQPIQEDRWYEHFTEQDWIRFREEADMILTAMNAGKETGPPLPPPPPPKEVNDSTLLLKPYIAASCIPSPFICLLCDDVIVGATTLDCGCPQSTVCIPCWEKRDTRGVDSADDDELEDLVSVQQNKSCPFCSKMVACAIPSHALDVAIFEQVSGLPEDHPVRPAYYRRVSKWRQEIERRQTKHNENQAIQRDELLAELIRSEEDAFWGTETTVKTKSFWEQNKNIIIAAGEIALMVGGFALFGRQLVRSINSSRRQFR